MIGRPSFLCSINNFSLKKMNVTITDTDSVQIISSTYQKVILNAPYIFLWSFSVLEYYYIKKNRTNSIPWGFLNITKIICNFLCLSVTTLSLITIFLGYYSFISKTVILLLIQLLTFVSSNFKIKYKSGFHIIYHLFFSF